MIRLVLTTLFVVILPVASVFAQQRGRHFEKPVRSLSPIDRAYEEGRITLDQRVLYKFYASSNPGKIPEVIRSELSFPVKCGTPALLEYLRFKPQLDYSTVAEVESTQKESLNRTLAAEETYLSATGKFNIRYYTSGDSAVPLTDQNNDGTPDYVEWVAEAADSSWQHEVQNLGYTDPVVSPSDPYEVRIESLNAYGETRLPSTGVTYIVIHNNFEGFPSNTDPEGDVRGAIKATMAHEIKHAVQYAATQWSGESDLWAEMDATLMEEVVYDNVNDYYNYLGYGGMPSSNPPQAGSIFLTPQISFYPGSYYHISWALFFEEKYGSDFWVNVWKKLKENPQSTRLTQAMDSTLAAQDSFKNSYLESQLWHFAAGPDLSPSDYGFEERMNYPDPTINTSFSGVDSLTSPVTIDPLSANYIEVSSNAVTPGFIRVEFTRSSPDIGMGLIAYFPDGSTERAFVSEGEALVIPEQTSWEWNNIERLGIVVANSSEFRDGTFRIKVITSIPEQITLSQNFPNPFYPSTTIPFTLNQESRVQLAVYDVLGRLVRTLIDETLPAGFYAPKLQGGDLASGVYVYRLVTDEMVLTKKMTLIK